MKRILRPILPIDRFGKGDRAVTITVWMAGLVQGFGQAQASASLPFSRAALGLTEGEMSLLLGLTRLGGFIALPLAWYADRHGRRKPFLLSLLLIVVGGAVTGLAFDAWQFGIAQAVLRTGTAAISGLAIVVLAETVSPPVRAYAISFYGAAVSLGSGLALLALPLADDGGEAWRRPYLLIASGLLLMPVLIRRVPETRIYQEATHDRAKWVDLTRGVWKGRFWTIIIVAFFGSAYGTFGTTFSTTRLVDNVGLSTATTVTILLVAGNTMAQMAQGGTSNEDWYLGFNISRKFF